jgi:hypothetical protein
LLGVRVTGRGENEPSVEQDVLFELNARVHEAARRFEGIEPERNLWEFACECGAADCREPVSLMLGEYEALREVGRRVLAPGHEEHARRERPHA